MEIVIHPSSDPMKSHEVDRCCEEKKINVIDQPII